MPKRARNVNVGMHGSLGFMRAGNAGKVRRGAKRGQRWKSAVRLQPHKYRTKVRKRGR